MQRLTLPDRLEIVQKFYANLRSFVSTQRSFTQEHGRHHRFDKQNIRRVVEKFKREFTLHDIKPPTRQRKARSNENIAAVKESVAERQIVDYTAFTGIGPFLRNNLANFAIRFGPASL